MIRSYYLLLLIVVIFMLFLLPKGLKIIDILDNASDQISAAESTGNLTKLEDVSKLSFSYELPRLGRVFNGSLDAKINDKFLLRNLQNNDVNEGDTLYLSDVKAPDIFAQGVNIYCVLTEQTRRCFYGKKI